MRIEIEVKSVYGLDKIYPVNEAAQTIARIAGTKTLSVQNLKDVCSLGLEVFEIKRNYQSIAQLIAAEACPA